MFCNVTKGKIEETVIPIKSNLSNIEYRKQLHKCCNSCSNRTLDRSFFLLKVNFHFADADAGTDFLYNLASAGPSLTFIELAPRTPEDRGYNEAVRIMHKLYLARETTCFILLSISVLLLSFPFYTADCGALFDNFTKLCFYCIQFSRSKEFVY